MLTCIDSCCLVNVINSGFSHALIGAGNRSFQFQGLVEDEIQRHEETVHELQQAGLLISLSGRTIFASEVADIVNRHNLGLGEAECIAISAKNGCALASDDRRARTVAISLLGRERVTGSIGLIRDALQSGAVSKIEAESAYRAMIAGGAFLPAYSISLFT